MKHAFLCRLTAASLAFSMISVPAVRALTLEQAGQLLEQYYIDDIPQNVLEQPTIPDMLNALGDPYTEYFSPEGYQQFMASMSDTSLVGIGVVFNVTEKGLLVNRTLEGSPAAEAGLQADDLIQAVDGKSVLGMDSNTITSWIQGEEGTQVQLTYLRGETVSTVTMTRKLVNVPATTGELLDDHIGYIQCTTFGSETLGHFQEIVADYKDKATVWIIDLRSNTGGSTHAATESAGLFTGPGAMTYFRDGSDEYSGYYHQNESETLSPVIVLMNSRSASSSEIFASAIRDHGAGIIVGTRSYGKGVAQTVLDQDALPEYFADGDAMKITAFRFYSPLGNTTDQIGVIPDLLVPADQIDGVARLLAGPAPTESTEGALRVDLDWQWHIDLQRAADPEYQTAFQTLIDAVPCNKKFRLGTGGTNGWKEISAQEAAALGGATYHASVFPDQNDSQYGEALSILKTYQLIFGEENGNFAPKDFMTRAELCQLLAVAMNCVVPNNSVTYADVDPSAWYTPAVLALSNMGMVHGLVDGLFHPEDTIDHQQFLTILGRMAEWLNMDFYSTAKKMDTTNTSLETLANYADWAKPSIWLLAYSQKGYFDNPINLLWEQPENIDPSASLTREEAAYTLYQLLSYCGALPA